MKKSNDEHDACLKYLTVMQTTAAKLVVIALAHGLCMPLPYHRLYLLRILLVQWPEKIRTSISMGLGNSNTSSCVMYTMHWPLSHYHLSRICIGVPSPPFRLTHMLFEKVYQYFQICQVL